MKLTLQLMIAKSRVQNILSDHKLRVSYNHVKTTSNCYGNS